MDRRYLQLEADALAVETREDGTSHVSGYAAVFYRSDDEGTQFRLWDNVYERILPGAFNQALERGDDVRALFNHDPNQILARTPKTLRLSTNKRGLRYEFDLPNTSAGRDIAESIRRGDITGSSFAFKVEDEAWRSEEDREIREVRSVRLFDVGPVTYPAYASTSTAVRSENEDIGMETRASFEAHIAAKQPGTPWRRNLAERTLDMMQADA